MLVEEDKAEQATCYFFEHYLVLVNALKNHAPYNLPNFLDTQISVDS